MRTAQQLKTQWCAIKLEAKKELIRHRKTEIKIEDGPPPQELSESTADLISWLPKEYTAANNEVEIDYIVGIVIIP